MIASKTRLSTCRPSSAPFKAATRPVQSRHVAVRASESVAEIVNKLKTLTLLEAAELVKEIETTFGVDASAAAPVAMIAGPAAAAAAPVVEEKTTFDVVLEDIPADKKVGIYKVVRNIAGIAVNQVKDFTATLPKTVLEGASKADAETAKNQLAEAGAKVKIA
ncbi:hypothetical protein CEUSTIGMA_g5378.t1 [Chlamydomonas eustigma]|uniref:Ribosomal protein L7/L12 C-terminal domain-containing protein n=1 Tax=Chlamydomonas eustigma TaxID=1157962 RepID=A0A250X4F3_9CHLO|nr:hypothetical protein CEUSTIGMA_g5378.t1 [Chlamydomonas eustigma]|eukprot:GAX77936.1 hypothetical protein CEUSTIGMA_g5378.t1 [Chlamydomonas eustigma]